MTFVMLLVTDPGICSSTMSTLLQMDLKDSSPCLKTCVPMHFVVIFILTIPVIASIHPARRVQYIVT